MTSLCSCPHNYGSKPSLSTAAGQESSQIVPKGWRSCNTLGTAALEKLMEVTATADKEYIVQCSYHGTLLQDIKARGILGNGHVTSATWHGGDWSWNIMYNSGSPFVLMRKKNEGRGRDEAVGWFKTRKNALRWKMERAWCLVYQHGGCERWLDLMYSENETTSFQWILQSSRGSHNKNH